MAEPVDTWAAYFVARRAAHAAHTVARASGGQGVATSCVCGYPTQTGRTALCEALDAARIRLRAADTR